MRHICGVVIVLLMAILVHCSAQENTTTIEAPEDVVECFHEPAVSCSKKQACVPLTSSNDTFICCHMNTTFRFKEALMILQKEHNNTRRLHIRNVTVDAINMTNFLLPNLESLAVTDSRVEKLVGQNITYLLSNLQCLNMSNNNIKQVDSHLIESLPKLQQLDLSFNNVTKLFLTLSSRKTISNFYLDVTNNSGLWCNNLTHLTAYMRNALVNLHVLNQNNTMCIIRRGVNYWFKIIDPVPFNQFGKYEEMERNCLAKTNCSCETYRSIYKDNKYLYNTIAVNCTGKNLTSLPEIPEHTVQLIITNNNISDLKRIKTDPRYSELVELVAQNNQISTLQDIEGSEFIKKLQELDLRGNKLNEIQTYIFNNEFKNGRGQFMKIRFGGNKIKCDCTTIQEIKLWLLKYDTVFQDYDDILCENINVNLMSLDANQVCKYSRLWTDYLNYIIAGEVVILFLLISKVSYDYWIFRTAGYLPWPASKMPKMPCDWVFET